MEQPEMEETSARGKVFDVGNDRTMTVAEIARETSRSVQAVRQQLAKGIRGEALLESNKPREAKGSWVAQRWAEAEARGLTPDEQRIRDRGDPRLLPSGAIAHDYVEHLSNL
jgi:hypothetical protein